MRLKALDQIHVSAVKTDSLRAGEEFDVGDEQGTELLTKHPTIFERLDAPAAKAAQPPKNKAALPSENKAAPAPAKKAIPRRKPKG